MSVTLERSDLPVDVVHTAVPIDTRALAAINEKPDDPDSPAWLHPAYRAMQGRWQRCRDAIAGTDVVHRRRTYLTQHPLETNDDYARRRAMTEFFNATARTVQAMTGLVYQRDPELVMPKPDVDGDGVEDAQAEPPPLPEAFVQWAKNVDGAGTSLTVFGQRAFRDGITVGLNGILTDFPRVPPGATAEDEARLRALPRWILVTAEQVVSWRVAQRGGAIVLQQLVIREDREEPHGEFGMVERVYYRRYWRPMTKRTVAGVETEEPGTEVHWELWREVTEGGTTKTERVPDQADILGNQTEIPFSPGLYGNDADAVWGCTPPLLDLVDTNLAHYAVRADRRYHLHLCDFPVPVRKGYNSAGAIVRGEAPNRELPIGSSILQDLPIGGDFEWKSPGSDSFAASREELTDIKSEMGALGLAFLAPETRAAETAEAKSIDATSQNASLASCVRMHVGCLNGALRHAAAFLKAPTAPVASISTEFERVIMEVERVRAFSEMEAKGQLSLETLWDVLKGGNVLPATFNAAQEQGRINVASARLVEAQGGAFGDGEGEEDEEDEEKQEEKPAA